mmetsp:Transcript_14599/g.16132  ORF Transcript_14599/g.16132 Transcript_14599/m.16132 type:complete len:242 (-) Transcript_14599:176-901(-)
MDLSNFDGVIRQIIMKNEGQIFMCGIELKHFSIILQKLFLIGDTTSSQRSFQKFFHFLILLNNNGGFSAFFEIVLGNSLSWELAPSSIVVELSCVLITIINEDITSIDIQSLTNTNVFWQNLASGSIALLNNSSLQENTLRGTTVGLFGFINSQRIVFQVKKEDDFADLETLSGRLHYGFLKITLEPEHGTVEFDPVGLELISSIISNKGRTTGGLHFGSKSAIGFVLDYLSLAGQSIHQV